MNIYLKSGLSIIELKLSSLKCTNNFKESFMCMADNFKEFKKVSEKK